MAISMIGPDSTTGQWDSEYHAPVLADEVLELLAGARTVLDGTLGGGGHSLALLARDVDVTAVDRDAEALNTARARLASYESAGHFRTVLGNYADVDRIEALDGARFDGILLDLGVSSHQLDDPSRGFSFREGVPLDMRMGADAERDAATLLSTADEVELAAIFREYADERRAMRLAREIVRRRGNRPFETSDDLVGAIRGALGPRTGPGDFARLFQAVRIAVNDEIGGLERALDSLRERLTPGGTMAVIAYHSGEDRVVKNAFRDWSASCICPPRQPVCTCRGHALGVSITRKPITASPEEADRNPRSRSARLRAWRSAP
ncbi:MAG TPA: 16S rRNA (cytosine(1402)-N(4))-methyltransferase RsmH [Gemmatimonadaceae bacterium]|nr:16S rRNA (cytosine(1402)-N(4))-methyltransferase RsmH [Gemmatimonadaceae bacterium]